MRVSLFCVEQRISWEAFLLEKLKQDPSHKAVKIIRLPGGKPAFAPSIGIHFSISDTKGLCVVALSREVLGVDVERLDRKASFLSIARRYFTRDEYRSLESAPDLEQRKLFLRYWTAKEACVKLDGCGLSRGLHDCKIDFTTESRAKALLFKKTIHLRALPAREQFLITIASYNPSIEANLCESEELNFHGI